MKNTKRSMLISGLCLLLTAVMLMGSTFAWFTDSVTNTGNKIEAGTLNVDLLMDKAHNGNYVSIADETGAIFSSDKDGNGYNWEPGMTQVVYLAVQNNGSLALNYSFVLDVVDNGLVGSLEYAVLNGTKAENMTEVKTWEDVVAKATADVPTTGAVGDVTAGETSFTPGRVLEAGETAYFAMAVHMKEEAGNPYQDGSVTIDVKLQAKQAMSETDGFGKDDYDKEAKYTVVSSQGFKEAIAEGGLIVLDSDVAVVPVGLPDDNMYPQTFVTKDTTLNLNGKTLGVRVAENESLSYCPLIISVTGGTLTIEGNGTLTAETGENECYGINVLGGSVVINDGNYFGALTAIQVQRGSLVINGGFFDLAPTCKAQVPQYYAKYVVNCIDRAYQNGTATIEIKGGTFVNFDPSNNPEGAGTSYVAEGYKVVSETQDNGDIWYTVVPE